MRDASAGAPGGNAAAPAPRITILLCTRNGAAHLEEQLRSYLAQDCPAWDLWVSDDGSTDGSRAILQAFRDAHGGGRRIRLLDGPGQGGTANFLSLLTRPDLPPGPVALSDQDDLWLPHKLSRALRALAGAPGMTLYGAQSLHADRDLRIIGRSRPPRRPPSFGNALVQNIVSGHSAVLSPGALDLVRRAGSQPGLPYHDWWLYQLVSGAGGQVLIDAEPVLRYRQHEGNVMGAHRGAAASLARIGALFGRGYGGWLAANRAALWRVRDLLLPEHRDLLARISAAPPGPARAMAMMRQGVRRQGGAATAALWLAAGLGRI